MDKKTVSLPKLGESIMGATVVQWLKKVGDKVSLDEALLEVSTDKVNSEIPSPFKGILVEILAEENQEIEIGAPLAVIAPEEASFSSPVEIVEKQMVHQAISQDSDFLSPAVLRIAQVEGISVETLRKMEGTGEGGRVTKKDLEKFLSSRVAPCPLATASAPSAPTFSGMEERVAMTGMRKAIAENMVRSFYEAPHASVVTEVDVTEVMQLISREKERFFAAHGAKLTITSFIVQALTKALQQFPMLNASLEGETIIMKRYINTGIAVNLENKGLVVPVIKNCQERNLVSIAKAISDVSQRARAGKLAPEDVKEGTLTLTNFGMTGALMGVPIIRYPEVAIIGAGAIQKRIVVREDDSFWVRQMMYLTLTFDHRVIDGIYGCEFLAAFKRQLESSPAP